jgi:hypothetical protein
MNTGHSIERGSKQVGTWVREALEPDQLTTSKMPYGRCKLSRGTLWLLWGLRVYVVFMAWIIVVAVWSALHTGG